jgi:hypothetical protein
MLVENTVLLDRAASSFEKRNGLFLLRKQVFGTTGSAGTGTSYQVTMAHRTGLHFSIS